MTTTTKTKTAPPTRPPSTLDQVKAAAAREREYDVDLYRAILEREARGRPEPEDAGEVELLFRVFDIDAGMFEAHVELRRQAVALLDAIAELDRRIAAEHAEALALAGAIDLSGAKSAQEQLELATGRAKQIDYHRGGLDLLRAGRIRKEVELSSLKADHAKAAGSRFPDVLADLRPPPWAELPAIPTPPRPARDASAD